MSTPNADHEKFLRRAIEMSERAALEYSTGGAFGAVLVKDGKIIAEGMNRVVASHDPRGTRKSRPFCASVASRCRV